jgi:hypothetical protein
LNAVQSQYPPTKIFNCDETSWKYLLAPQKVLAYKGTETVKIRCDVDEKKCITAMGTITASGDKLPLWIISKGKTPKCLEKFGQTTTEILSFTESGWCTEELFLNYLEWLSQSAANAPLALVLDIYPTHRTERVKTFASEHSIQLLFVPAGATGRLQPLDYRIFGELKQRARKPYKQIAFRTGTLKASDAEVLNVLRKSWDQVSKENVIKAWKVS